MAGLNAQTVFADEFHRARLRAFVPLLFVEGDARADFQLVEAIVEYAVTVEIDLPVVRRPHKAEAFLAIEFDDRRQRRRDMGFDLPLHPPLLILQPTARALERFVEGE